MLVLGAGGALGEAWLRGLLAGLEAAPGSTSASASTCVGTSAGSIVATTLRGRAAARGGRARGAHVGRRPRT